VLHVYVDELYAIIAKPKLMKVYTGKTVISITCISRRSRITQTSKIWWAVQLTRLQRFG